MHVHSHNTPYSQWHAPFAACWRHGRFNAARGLGCYELTDVTLDFNPRWPLAAFAQRGLKPGYLVGELAWYLRGDREDRSIEAYAGFWKQVANPVPPTFYSNYGHYLFREMQFARVVERLVDDPDTRQAVVVIATREGMAAERDKPCTYAVSFRIREGALHMSVSMRSNDLVRGLCVDVFQWSVVMQMAWQSLRPHYPTLDLGVYTHRTDSLHYYEEHAAMVQQIATGSQADFDDVLAASVPTICSFDEVLTLQALLPDFEENIRLARQQKQFIQPGRFPFFDWCLAQLHKKWTKTSTTT